MTWTRVDDGLYEHPKLLSAGPLARDLFTCTLQYCNRYLTDGWISHDALRALGRYDGLYVDAPDTLPGMFEPVSVETVIVVLVSNGLLERHGERYRVHDFLDYQPSRSEVEQQRALWREQKRRRRQAEQADEVRCERCTLSFKTQARLDEHAENVHGRVLV
jgi:hypothetical protein